MPKLFLTEQHAYSLCKSLAPTCANFRARLRTKHCRGREGYRRTPRFARQQRGHTHDLILFLSFPSIRPFFRPLVSDLYPFSTTHACPKSSSTSPHGNTSTASFDGLEKCSAHKSKPFWSAYLTVRHKKRRHDLSHNIVLVYYNSVDPNPQM